MYLKETDFFHKDSYEIEVYLYEADEIEIDRKLKFYEQDRQIENNMLVEASKHFLRRGRRLNKRLC